MKKIKKILILSLLIIITLLVVYKFCGIEKKVLTLIFPKRYEEYINKYSNEFEIDPLLTFAIIKAESNFDSKVISKSGAIGLMQVMEKTAEEQGKKLKIDSNKDNLLNAEINIRIGLSYFKTLLEHFDNNYILAFAAYNAGMGNVQKWISEGILNEEGSNFENIPFKETNLYVRKVIKNYEIYKYLYK